MKQVYYQFKQHGIVIPMPIRALQIGAHPEKSAEASIAAAEVAELMNEMRERNRK
jgi:hypothetical protein